MYLNLGNASVRNDGEKYHSYLYKFRVAYRTISDTSREAPLGIGDGVESIVESMDPLDHILLLGRISDNAAHQIAAVLQIPVEDVRDLGSEVLRTIKDEVFADEVLPPPMSDSSRGQSLTGGAVLRLVRSESPS